MSLRSLATLQIFWLVEHGCPFFADSMSRLGKQKRISLYPDKSVQFSGVSMMVFVASFSLTSPWLLLRLHAIAAHPANISQIHTGKGELKGGGAGMLAGGREKEGGRGRGVLG